MSNTTTTRSLEMLLTLSNPVFGCYIFWCSVLVIKMLLMSILTNVQRLRFKSFISPEDGAFVSKDVVQPNGDPHVERVRSAHLNDMENILPFFTMGLIFVCVDPGATMAMILFRIEAAARIIHTLVYAFGPVPQPSRAIAFYVGFLVTIFMGFYCICYTIKFI